MPLPASFGLASAKAAPDLSGYVPTAEYAPTHQICRCLNCRAVGDVVFIGGFSLAAGDRLMKGRPIRGMCGSCRRETELVPIGHLLSEKDKKELGLLVDMKMSLEAYAKRGYDVPSSGAMVPHGRLEAYERWCEARAAG